MEEQDQWTERDVALDRYRRHHDYMAELFSPHSVDRIDPPQSPFDLSKEETDKLKTQLTLNEAELDAINGKHRERLERVKADDAQFRESLANIQAASSPEELEARRKTLEDAGLVLAREDTVDNAQAASTRTPTVRVKKVPVPESETFPHSENLLSM
ncbi:hypothetical protein THASP1DRAFT_29954 [Thamnocephalis sphaerospora]|uniref:Uncharacterized protein n=1 Tax=Thamnocephalis sphaerospora TaxID=78915 RepID=A0A4P9XRV3_9FUNG|nr:hypothetical protein THASP1DRAFT_29954 [Thamnocephalis sphaerospora]|eukprot:RKP08241.1 hypothetical protein THASP1DRAFT_29954 [Thamnocephalis sphaerospora]